MTTTSPISRLALLPADTRPAAASKGAVVRRYRLGRVIGDLGPMLACAPQRQAPAAGGRAP